MQLSANQRMGAVAASIFLSDQFTKLLVLRYLPNIGDEHMVLPGFFKFVHWGNTGAAWSMFHGNNEMLTVISLVALMFLFLLRHHFEAHTRAGQFALGLMFGGIMGNLYDRMHVDRGHVIDFLYFHLQPRGGKEVGFPAFNVADSAICVGVGLLFILSWKKEQADAVAPVSDTPAAPPASPTNP